MYSNLVFDYSFDACIVDPGFGVSQAASEYEIANGTGERILVRIQYGPNYPGDTWFLADHKGHYLDFVNGFRARGAWMTQNVLPSHGPRFFGRYVVRWNSSDPVDARLLLLTGPTFGFRIRNINFICNLIKF